jgi:berberine-like enzyme
MFVQFHQSSAGLPAACELHIHQGGGAFGRVPADATAFSQRDAAYIVNCIARTPSLEGFGPAVEWAKAARNAVADYGSGRSYVNYTGDAEPARVRESYPPATYDRLAAVKARLDPDNVFRFNQNVRPRTG